MITTNPPYMLAEHGLRNPDDRKAIARHEVLCTLDDILRESMHLFAGQGQILYDPQTVPADGDPDKDESVQD